MLVNQSIEEFVSELASSAPAPGGGSVAALAGTLGGALTAMVCNLTVDNNKYREVQGKIKDILAEADKATSNLKIFIDEDTKAFTSVIAAYKLPRCTDDEKEIRIKAIQEALKQASVLPLEVAKECLAVLKLAYAVSSIGNMNAVSDAAIAGIMAHAGIHSAIYNIKINTCAIKDEDFVRQMDAKVQEIVKAADKLHKELIIEADRLIAG